MLIIEELKKIGYRITLQGEELKLTWAGEGKPDPVQVKPLLEELKARKVEAIRYLKDKEQGKIIDFHVEVEKVKAVLQRKGIAAIQSRTLDGETVFLANDEKAAAKAPQGAVVYTLDELRELTRGNLTREGLRQIHMAKKIFNGRIVQNSKNPFNNL